MPFLPDSIRGEDYDPDKDESLNLQAYQEAIQELGVKNKNDRIYNPGILIDLPDDDQPTEQSMAEVPTTHAEVMVPVAYIGSTPIETIMTGIDAQFDDYIKCEDTTNYVDVFYDQLHASYEAANDDSNLNKQDIIETLDTIHQNFIDGMAERFNTRLTITIAELDGESPDPTEIEFLIRRLYEFFILGAKNNFKAVIARDVRKKIGSIADPKAYFNELRSLMLDYSPLITTIGPMEFLRYRGDKEIIQFFEDGKISGNFLRKYSPKLYQNEEFEVELINHITMLQQIKEELFNGRQ